MNLLEVIRKFIDEDKLQWRGHILTRMLQRQIKVSDIIECLNNGEIIEEYDKDYPFPSFLILGFSKNKPLHVVCSVGEGYLWMITVYSPDPKKWDADYKVRRN